MNRSDLIELTADIICAYVSGNVVTAAELPKVIDYVHMALVDMQNLNKMQENVVIAASLSAIISSVRHERLVSFIDGKQYKSLKRHLTAHGLTPERYRARYGLPADYPMVAPSYAAQRSQIAKAIGLGLKAV